MSDHESDRLFRAGQYDQAAERLRKGLESEGEDGKDGLLFLLDLGLSLHAAGKYEESNRAFLRADKIAEIKDYTSLAAEGATLLTSDNIKQYKGEDFEKVLINTYLAMNYSLMGDFENALVEARRVNRKLYLMVTDGQKKYKQNAFARYLSAVLYEAQDNYNDAYVDYKKTFELEPAFPGLGKDLWRCAQVVGIVEDADKWDTVFHLTAKDHEDAKRAIARSGKSEIIVIYENGISPIKRPNPQFSELPKFYPRPNPVRAARVSLGGREVATTAVLHDIEQTAIENLDEKYGGLIAKKIAGVVVKEVIADQVARQTKSEALGFLTKLAMYASDQADVRSWNLLPRDLELARITVEPGTYALSVDPIGAGSLPPKTVQVSAGQKIFVDFRYMP